MGVTLPGAWLPTFLILGFAALIGARSLRLAGGGTRSYHEDGDEAIFRAHGRRDGFAAIGFGECRELAAGREGDDGGARLAGRGVTCQGLLGVARVARDEDERLGIDVLGQMIVAHDHRGAVELRLETGTQEITADRGAAETRDEQELPVAVAPGPIPMAKSPMLVVVQPPPRLKPPAETQVALAAPAELSAPTANAPDARAPTSNPPACLSLEIALCLPISWCLPMTGSIITVRTIFAVNPQRSKSAKVRPGKISNEPRRLS